MQPQQGKHRPSGRHAESRAPVGNRGIECVCSPDRKMLRSQICINQWLRYYHPMLIRQTGLYNIIKQQTKKESWPFCIMTTQLSQHNLYVGDSVKINPSINQSINRSIDQSIHQSINHYTTYSESSLSISSYLVNIFLASRLCIHGCSTCLKLPIGTSSLCLNS